MSTTPSQASLHTSIQHQVVHYMAWIYLFFSKADKTEFIDYSLPSKAEAMKSWKLHSN